MCSKHYILFYLLFSLIQQIYFSLNSISILFFHSKKSKLMSVRLERSVQLIKRSSFDFFGKWWSCICIRIQLEWVECKDDFIFFSYELEFIWNAFWLGNYFNKKSIQMIHFTIALTSMRLSKNWINSMYHIGISF